ncbi:MAG: RNA pseudouridine synthase [Thermoanaerobaculia bacterium]|nr:RNA pseudouridine synthase [Thermoanaerobaculia bacterium]
MTRRDSPQEAPPSAAAKRTAERKSTRTLPATLLFFGDRFAAIDKPAGLSLRTSRADPHGAARGLVEALRFRDRELFAGREPQLVHRLDESTSGVVLVALDVDIHRELVGRFAARQAEKRYLALVWGHPKPAAGVWEERLGPDRKDRRRMKVDPEGRPALTEYRTLARAAHVALLELTPRTGRTHQLRVHLAAAGHPIVGDDLYGGPREHGIRSPALRSALAPGRSLLHAFRLTIPGLEPESFEAPLPADFATALAACGIAGDAALAFPAKP